MIGATVCTVRPQPLMLSQALLKSALAARKLEHGQNVVIVAALGLTRPTIHLDVRRFSSIFKVRR